MRIEGTIKVQELAAPFFVDFTTDAVAQGFDEFMNLVIEDAVEVKQPTKTNPDESRESLGEWCSPETDHEKLIGYRPDIAQG